MTGRWLGFITDYKIFEIFNTCADLLATMFISEDRDIARTKKMKIFYKSNIKQLLMSLYCTRVPTCKLSTVTKAIVL